MQHLNNRNFVYLIFMGSFINAKHAFTSYTNPVCDWKNEDTKWSFKYSHGSPIFLNITALLPFLSSVSEWSYLTIFSFAGKYSSYAFSWQTHYCDTQHLVWKSRRHSLHFCAIHYLKLLELNSGPSCCEETAQTTVLPDQHLNGLLSQVQSFTLDLNRKEAVDFRVSKAKTKIPHPG